MRSTALPRRAPTPTHTPAADRSSGRSHRPVRRPRRVLRLAAFTAAVVALVGGPAAAASAHVRVTSDSTAAGVYALLTFRVPNESVTASTTRLDVTLPTDHPFTYAAVQPVPGWTATVTEAPLPEPVVIEGTTITKAPASITWTAQPGSEIAPGQFQQFPISVGALPKAGTTVSLPATQTYSDGTVVRWDEPTPASGKEPEHPAPNLTTTAATGSDDGPTTPGASVGVAGSSTGGAASDASGGTSGTAGLWLGLVGAVLGAAALAVTLLRGRRPAGSAA